MTGVEILIPLVVFLIAAFSSMVRVVPGCPMQFRLKKPHTV